MLKEYMQLLKVVDSEASELKYQLTFMDMGTGQSSLVSPATMAANLDAIIPIAKAELDKRGNANGVIIAVEYLDDVRTGRKAKVGGTHYTRDTLTDKYVDYTPMTLESGRSPEVVSPTMSLSSIQTALDSYGAKLGRALTDMERDALVYGLQYAG
jgi:hypothetical protein